jgi:hypothetical protein
MAPIAVAAARAEVATTAAEALAAWPTLAMAVSDFFKPFSKSVVSDPMRTTSVPNSFAILENPVKLFQVVRCERNSARHVLPFNVKQFPELFIRRLPKL